MVAIGRSVYHDRCENTFLRLFMNTLPLAEKRKVGHQEKVERQTLNETEQAFCCRRYHIYLNVK